MVDREEQTGDNWKAGGFIERIPGSLFSDKGSNIAFISVKILNLPLCFQAVCGPLDVPNDDIFYHRKPGGNPIFPDAFLISNVNVFKQMGLILALIFALMWSVIYRAAWVVFAKWANRLRRCERSRRVSVWRAPRKKNEGGVMAHDIITRKAIGALSILWMSCEQCKEVCTEADKTMSRQGLSSRATGTMLCCCDVSPS